MVFIYPYALEILYGLKKITKLLIIHNFYKKKKQPFEIKSYT